MAKSTQSGKTMKEQADDILAMMEVGTDEELKQVHAGGQKDSKWRRVVLAFYDAKEGIWKIPAPEDGPYKINAITSGLNNALDTLEEAGNKLPVRVTSSKAKGLVLLVNDEIVESADVENAEATA